MNSRILVRHATIVALALATLTRTATAADHQAAQTRPIQLGTSGGNINDRSLLYCCSGTLGALVQDAAGVQYILSNNHVLGRVNQGQTGFDPVSQPGMIDQNCGQVGILATLDRLVPIQFGKGRNKPLNEVDAAIALVATVPYAEGGTGPGVRTDGSILGIGIVSSATVPASLGQAVQKSGRTTALTTGSVSATDVTVDVGYSAECGGPANQVARFVNQILISPGSFSAGGDSGSVIFESGQTPRAMGLLFAGSSSSTIANPIDSVLAALDVTMVGGSSSSGGILTGIVTDSGSSAGISGATVTVDSGISATTDGQGTYSISGVPAGSRTVTASANGYTSKNSVVTVTAGQTTSASFALDPVPVGTAQAIVQCVTYTQQGGKNKDKDLVVTISVVDNSGAPLAGAQVDISVLANGQTLTGTGAISSSSGEVAYVIRNAASGTYATKVASVTKAGFTFEGSTPNNSFTKGTDPSPSSFCRTGTTTASTPVGAEKGKAALDHVRAVKSRHGNGFMEVDDVVGHGIGRNEAGEPVIEVYLEKENANARARIPARVENVPVRIVVTGPFTAY